VKNETNLEGSADLKDVKIMDEGRVDLKMGAGRFA
jgi:hypothetical protein